MPKRIRHRFSSEQKAALLKRHHIDVALLDQIIKDASGGSDKPRRLEIDPPRAAMVREMFDLCIRGYSAREISRHMRARYTH